jgi:hypothetical protein
LEVLVEVKTCSVPAAAGIDHEKFDEVAAEEAGWLHDDESADRAVVEINQALPETHAAPEKVSPAFVSAGGAMIGAHDAVDVVGDRAPDLGLPLYHRPSLAYVRARRSAADQAAHQGLPGLVVSLDR